VVGGGPDSGKVFPFPPLFYFVFFLFSGQRSLAINLVTVIFSPSPLFSLQYSPMLVWSFSSPIFFLPIVAWHHLGQREEDDFRCLPPTTDLEFPPRLFHRQDLISTSVFDHPQFFTGMSPLTNVPLPSHVFYEFSLNLSNFLPLWRTPRYRASFGSHSPLSFSRLPFFFPCL